MPKVLASKDRFLDFAILQTKVEQNNDGMIVD